MAAPICAPRHCGSNSPTASPANWGAFAKALAHAQARNRLAAVTRRLDSLEAEAAGLRADLATLRATLGQSHP